MDAFLNKRQPPWRANSRAWNIDAMAAPNRAAFATIYGPPLNGQSVGLKQIGDEIWLVSFMEYDLGYFDHQTCRLEPIEDPFGPKVLPMSPV